MSTPPPLFRLREQPQGLAPPEQPTRRPEGLTPSPREYLAVVLAGVTILLILALSAVIYLLMTGNRAAPPQAGVLPTAVADAKPRDALPRTGSSVASRAITRWADQTYAPLDPEVAAPTQFFPPRVPLPALDFIDSVTFETADLRIRLAGVKGINRSDVCYNADRTKIACGLMGRASLANYISKKTLVCYRDVSLLGDESAYFCSVQGQDLGQFQIKAGFARPAATDIEYYDRLLEQARLAGNGAWAGGWTVVPPTP